MTETKEAPKDPRLIDAEIRKTIAEAAKAEAETKAFELDAVIKKEEARQKAAHALSAEYGAEQLRVQTEATQRQERLAKASNHLHHVYNFTTPVFEDSVDACLAQLHAWDRQEPGELDGEGNVVVPGCPMTVVLNSPGGSVIDGMQLFDEIDRYSLRGGGTHKTTGIVRGWAASMAGILFQAFDERVIGKESWLMIHEVSSFAQGKIGDIEDEVEFLKAISKRVATKFIERSGGKGGMTLEKFESNEGWERREWYLDSAQTLAYGFADRIG